MGVSPRCTRFDPDPATLCRVIASQAAVPLVYVPIEAVASKWYGESERLLSDVFRQSDRLAGCIVFLDELDSLAASRCAPLGRTQPLCSDLIALSAGCGRGGLTA